MSEPMNRESDRLEAELERLKAKDYPPTLEGKLDATRDVTRVLYTDIPIQGKFEYRDAFLKRLQKYIRKLSGRTDEMSGEVVLMFGIYFGDHLLKWFRGGRWEYYGSDPTLVSKLCVRWGDEIDGVIILPVKRVAKFLRDPTDDFVSSYMFLKHREAVSAAMDNAELGVWVNMPDNLLVRRVSPD